MAHRGWRTRAPENSLAAFDLALAAGADALETDLWFTSDGVLVCHHDATLQRTTGDPRRVDALAAAEIAALRLFPGPGGRFAGEGIPTLAALLALAPPDVLLTLELKDPRFTRPEAAAALAAALAARRAERTAVVVSFNRDRLDTLRAVAPDIPIGHITVGRLAPPAGTELAGPIWPALFANPFYVRLAHRRGQLVCPLDPRPEPRLRLYLRLGADALLTDDIGLTLARLGRITQRS
jgi:glycerophosphoryl diester phosphodiesterase